jgi:hypothetical protein
MYQSLQRREINRGGNTEQSNENKPASRMRLRNIIAYYGGGGVSKDPDEGGTNLTSRNVIFQHTRNNTIISPSSA